MRLSEKLIIMLDMECVPRADVPTIEQAIALAKRYEDAPVGFVMGQGLLTGGAAAIVQMERPEDVKGQRVRILLDTER